ncbi:protein tamozhennic [Aedes aegypti]|uniref:RanBP2-type domain-containing protein n=1 Tax=Aedes aegypti TaxID=7159 RepID=A0A6I8TIE4_AEDAE|nr:protein tamozhennic [Aedes aegypti]XP_021699453.1 protein tamozhennic [Aedes aegypti]XP_021699454.1 protein tamozhennic [Aedes aegypti]
MAPVYEQNDVLGALWEEIIQVHWKFLDADESMQKIEHRRQLEELILQYLCNIPHNHKFYLPPTVRVLESSIAKLDDFSAYKAANGFEAISQYANNLFTKPWRKEYKVIKMYSGFYQHEIAANLMGAEVLFEEMGYRTMPNQTLVLEGPICPDRVTNVSKDAITANVECQIMINIYRGLTEMSLRVNWSDIYNFRERNTMDIEQSIQLMATLIQEKHQKTQQARRKDSYGSTLAPAVSSCNSCNPYQFHPHMQQQQQQPPAPSMAVPPQTPQIPFCGPQPLYNTVPCSMHSQPPIVYSYHHHNNYQSYLPNSPSQAHIHPSGQSAVMNPHQPPHLGTIPHSKSLDHYQNPTAAMYNLTASMQRHSIDQAFDYAAASSASHYGGPMGMGPPTGTYDTVDNCNIPFINHPYNVSGNRFPLPYNLSTNLGPCMNGIPGKPNGNEPFYQASINGYHQMPQYYHHRNSSNGPIYAPQTQPHRHASDIYMNQNFDHSGTQTPTSILSKKKTSYDDYEVPSIRNGADAKSPGDLIYIDTREEAKKERKKSDRGAKNPDLLVDYESEMLPAALVERNQQQHHRHHQLHHQTSRNSRQSDFDSYEDEQLQSGANQRASNVTKRITSKNQDGIGSYEQWNYVFQNLEKQGYTKDLGERGDFLVDVDDEEYPETLNASRNGTLKRSSNDKLKAMKPKSADKVDGIRMASSKQTQSSKHDRDNERNEAAVRSAQKPISVQKVVKPSSNNQTDNSHQKSNHISNPTHSTIGGTINRRNSITRKVSTSSKENGISANPTSGSNATGGGILVNHNSSNHTSASTSGKKKTASFDTAAATIINSEDNRTPSNNGYGSRSEWNCEFCTFLNPETKRICEMCAKSRDFKLSSETTTATSNGKATCV